MGEDVNPSAYIVNMVDCMLVLACGFLVMLMLHWNIATTTMDEVDESSMEEVDPEQMPEDVTSGGYPFPRPRGRPLPPARCRRPAAPRREAPRRLPARQ